MHYDLQSAPFFKTYKLRCKQGFRFLVVQSAGARLEIRFSVVIRLRKIFCAALGKIVRLQRIANGKQITVSIRIQFF